MRHLIVVAAATFAMSATASSDDPFRIIKLEQDVRNLERQVQTLSRQLDELRTQAGRTGAQETAREPRAPSQPPSTWLDIGNWDRLRVGMSELDVIRALGPPTTMRQENGTRVLLYALEIGASGFLAGSVRLEEREVVAIDKPALR
jgi:hypothetical protein